MLQIVTNTALGAHCTNITSSSRCPASSRCRRPGCFGRHKKSLSQHRLLALLLLLLPTCPDVS
jgi:hypothetical protein